MKLLKVILFWIVVFVMFILFIWGAYWLIKHGSYYLWYEDMVQETVRELVKLEALK